MIGTHEEWEELRDIKSKLLIQSNGSMNPLYELYLRLNNICYRFELTEKSFLNHGEEK